MKSARTPNSKSSAHKTSVSTVQRCAIYTRKSTDHNLDLAFNSLDAQREACEAYIKSQAHEGWRLVPDRFDDGAFSGASLDRPALQALLEQVRANKIDIIVVYKVDRLTRSLSDFAKLVELFDEHEASFVSVTQSFNTTSSMGRLTLNVLLSFAQFEREVIGERVRDKISASKRKGIWVGGPIPLGYRSVDKKLEVVAEEADLVREMFESYLRLGSIGELAAELNRQGLKPKPRTFANGRTVAPPYYRIGPLAHLLKNRFYIGEVVYRGEINKGEHQPIIDRELFESVQSRLAEGAVSRSEARLDASAILTGLIFDDRQNPMTPSHAKKNGVRYRYYVSHALLQNRKDAAGSIARVSAPDVEALVLNAIRSQLNDADHASDRDVAQAHVARVTVHSNRLEIQTRDLPTEDPLTIPFAPRGVRRRGVAHQPSDHGTLDAEARHTLLHAIARARNWMDQIDSGNIASIDSIAAAETLAERHVRFLLPLAYLSPRIIMAIAKGTAPGNLTVSDLARALPHKWSEQERILRTG
jgi:site-specific DNA recombinase